MSHVLYGLGPFDALVLDCDGVTVDSEPLSVAAWTRAANSLGLALDDGEIAGFVGLTERDLAEHLAPRARLPVQTVEEAAARAFRHIVRVDGIAAYPDAMALIDRWGERPIAIASNSPRWRLDTVLTAAGVPVATTVASDEVTAPKPAPDVYLRAMELLGVAPSGCLVVEDTPTGIAAGKEAGAYVVAVSRGLVDPESLCDADRVVDML